MVNNPFVGGRCSLQSVLDFCSAHQVGEIKRLCAEVAAASSTRTLTRNVRLAIAILSRMKAANLPVPSTYCLTRRPKDGYVLHAFTFYTKGSTSYTALADKTGIIIVRDFHSTHPMVMRCLHNQKQHMLVSDQIPDADELKELDESIVPWFNQFMFALRTHIRSEVPKIVYSIAGDVRGDGYAKRSSEEIHSHCGPV
jgi:hypothetical protein